MATNELPLPPHYNPAGVVDAARWVDYEALAPQARAWRDRYGMKAASTDKLRIGALGIDIQETFCNPKGELYVAGASGRGAVDDSIRTTEWLYKNMHRLTGLDFTLDTHRAYAVFHATFLVDENGNHPAPFTTVSNADVVAGKWRVSPQLCSALGIGYSAAQKHLEHYTRELDKASRYDLTIWPFHGMLGGKGHTMVTGVEEAAFFHAIARGAQTGFEVKGTNPLVENYSVLGPEVTSLFDGTPVARNAAFVQKLLDYDVLVIFGQAKSHCVAWTIDDLLREIAAKDPKLARKVYLLEDCTTPIVVKDPAGNLIYSYEADADKAFDRFKAAGMHVVQSTTPMEQWPGVTL